MSAEVACVLLAFGLLGAAVVLASWDDLRTWWHR